MKILFYQTAALAAEYDTHHSSRFENVRATAEVYAMTIYKRF